MSSTGHLYGAGIYSEVFCTGSADYNNGEHATALVVSVATLPSNCAQRTDVNINPAAGYAGVGP